VNFSPKPSFALHSRTFYAAFPEHPAPAIYGEQADAEGQQKFKSFLGNKFEELKQSAPLGWSGQEESPYLQEPLGITYPIFTPETLVARAKNTRSTWRKIGIDDRAEFYFESLGRIRKRFFSTSPMPPCIRPGKAT